MKELSIEEKAKCYDDDIERARIWKDRSGMPKDRQGILDDIFPELKEENEDVRGTLYDYFKRRKDEGVDETWFGISYDKILSWLEKQGKNNMGISETTKKKLDDMLNKALEKETPESWNEFLDKQAEKSVDKLKVSDELYEHIRNTCACIDDALSSETLVDVTDYLSMAERSAQSAFDMIEKQDEKKEINLVEILKHYPRETELYSPLYGKLWLAEVDEEHEIITCYKYQLDEGCVRAKLEQEDTVSFYSDGTTGLPDFSVSKDCMLFLYDVEKQGVQKPIDYPLAHEKMEAERLGQACKAACCDRNYRSHNGLTETRDDYFVDGVHWADEHPKQNPAWSEDDDATHTRILGALGKVFMGGFPTKPSREDIEWFKFLPKRFSLRPNQEWSEDDEKIFEKIISDYIAASKSFCGHQGKLDWLKTIKDRVQPQPNQEWSEEDERNLKCMMKIIKEKAFADYDVDEDNNMLGIYGILESWLKSIKERYAWKPSDEHIRYLQAVVNDVHNIGSESCCIALRDLLEQLKKL